MDGKNAWLSSIGQSKCWAASLLIGCSTIQHVPVEGWPVLKVIENKVSWPEVIAQCSKYVSPIFWPPFACAEIYVEARECRITYAFDWTLEHERDHCAGMDHPGGTEIARLRDKFNGK